MDLYPRFAAHPTRPSLTSRRCSPERNALGWLPGPGRAVRRVIKGPGVMGGATVSGCSQSDGGRQKARRLREGPIRRPGVLAAPSRDGLGCGVHPVTAGGSRGLRSGEGRRGEGRARLPGVPRGGPLLCGCAWELTFQGEAWRPLYSHFWLEPSYALTFSPGPTRPPKPRKGFVGPSRPPSGADWPSVQCSECVGRPGVAPAQPWTSGPPT